MSAGFALVVRIDPKLKAAIDRKLRETQKANPGLEVTRASVARMVLAQALGVAS